MTIDVGEPSRGIAPQAEAHHPRGLQLLRRPAALDRARETPAAAAELVTSAHPWRILDGRAWTVVLVAADFLALCAAVALTVRWPHEPLSAAEGAALFAVPPATVALLACRGAYERRLRGGLLGGGLVGAVSLVVMGVVVFETYVLPPGLSSGAVVHLWGLSIVFLQGGRLAAAACQHWARARALVARPTLIAGGGVVGAKIAERLMADPQYGLRPVGFLDEDPLPVTSIGTGLPTLGGPDQFERVVRATGARHLVVAFPSCSDRSFVPLLRRSKRAGVEVSVVPRMFEATNDRVSFATFGGIPVFDMHETDPLGWRFSVKHAVDRVIAATFLLLLSPIFLALAATVRLSSPGPILFRQARVGRDGRIFDLLKFRSMRVDPPGAQAAFTLRDGSAPGGVEGIDRRTAVGRFMRRTSLDELPQLWNVLTGEMSLVGPRPERLEFVEIFRRDIERYGDRHRVKAGITGWAQVHGLRGQTSISDRAEMDNFYIENWSLRLDLRILALTVLAVLRFVED